MADLGGLSRGDVPAAQKNYAKLREAEDLVQRSFAGPIGCVVMVVVLLLSTSLYREHPVATGLFVGALLLRVGPRPLFALWWRRRTVSRPVPLWLIALSGLLLSFPAGLFSAFVVRHYGLDHWNSLLLFVFTMSCSLASTAVIAPNLKLGLFFQGTLLLPLLAGCLWAGTAHSVVAAFCVALFSLYVAIHATRLNADYWNAITAELALKQRAEELAAAKMAADAASQAKSQFLALMSHEIRTPMNGVLGMLELALGGELSVGQRESLGYARQAALNLRGLLNDLLDFSKAEAGKLDLEEIDFSPRSVLEQVLSPLRRQAAGKGIALSDEVAADVPASLRGDPTRFGQIAINMVSNAIKFTEKGSIVVTASVDSIEGRAVTVHLQVADTGPGIAPDKINRIFEAFTQEDGSTTRRFGGTGLGLAICRELSSLMGGRVWAESELGQGSVFHFTARFAVSDQARAEAASPVSVRDLRAVTPLRILAAEDNLINQKLLTGLLSASGHSLLIVKNGQEALEMLPEGSFDLVLMDVQMPVLDGLETTRRIRLAEAATGNHIPIVGVTAGASGQELAQCLASGMDHCITKPIVIAELKNVLERVARGDFQAQPARSADFTLTVRPRLPAPPLPDTGDGNIAGWAPTQSVLRAGSCCSGGESARLPGHPHPLQK